MGRKNRIEPFKILSLADMSIPQVSLVSDITQLDGVGIVVNWAGASPSGTITVEAANLVASDNYPAVWQALNFGSTITVSGNTGSHLITINNIPYAKLRVRYTPTSGTGQLTLILTAKTVGA